MVGTYPPQKKSFPYGGGSLLSPLHTKSKARHQLAPQRKGSSQTRNPNLRSRNDPYMGLGFRVWGVVTIPYLLTPPTSQSSQSSPHLLLKLVNETTAPTSTTPNQKDCLQL